MNVVEIMTDDQTAASLAYMGNVNNLLGGNGTTFDQAIDSFPLCCPSRATNLTGQYAHNHGVLHNAPPFGGFIQLDGTSTLPVWLQAAGYRTMHVGRYLNGYEAKYGIPPGWTDWVGLPHSAAFNYFAWKAFDHGVVRDYPDAAHPGEYLTDFETRKGVELIDDASGGDRPFYLSLWYTAPHRGAPRDPDDPRRPGTPSPALRHRDAYAGVRMPRPPSFNERNMYDKPQVVADRPRLSPELEAGVEENWRQENEALMAVDEGVSQIVEALRRNGQLDNTLIVFLSDNGFMHGEHRALAEKVLPYEESIRVPLVLRGPGVPRARVDHRLVGERRRDLDDPRRDRRAAGPRAGRPLAARATRRPGRRVGPRHPDRERQTARTACPPTAGSATTASCTWSTARPANTSSTTSRRTRSSCRAWTATRRTRACSTTSGRACARWSPASAWTAWRDRTCRCRCAPAAAPSRGCFTQDLRVQLRGSKRARLLHADVMIGRRRVERLLNIPTARGEPGGPVTLSGVVKRQQIHRRGRFRLRVLAETVDGRKLTLDRTLRRCP